MKSKSIRDITILGLAILVAVSVSACEPQPVRINVKPELASIPASGSRDIVTSIQDSLRYLLEDGDRWLEGEIWVIEAGGANPRLLIQGGYLPVWIP